jgi:hypothetical protein
MIDRRKRTGGTVLTVELRWRCPLPRVTARCKIGGENHHRIGCNASMLELFLAAHAVFWTEL